MTGLDALTATEADTAYAVEREGLDLFDSTWIEAVPLFGTRTPERWQAYAAWIVEHELIPDDLDPAAAFMTALLPAAAPVSVATPTS